MCHDVSVEDSHNITQPYRNHLTLRQRTHTGHTGPCQAASGCAFLSHNNCTTLSLFRFAAKCKAVLSTGSLNFTSLSGSSWIVAPRCAKILNALVFWLMATTRNASSITYHPLVRKRCFCDKPSLLEIKNRLKLNSTFSCPTLRLVIPIPPTVHVYSPRRETCCKVPCIAASFIICRTVLWKLKRITYMGRKSWHPCARRVQ